MATSNLEALKEQQQSGTSAVKADKHKFQRLQSLRIVSLGTRYTTKYRTTTMTMDGQPLSTAEASKALSTWCARRAAAPEFFETFETNIRKLSEDINHTAFKTKVITIDPINQVDELKQDINLKMQRLLLSALPIIPSQFSQDGHQYAVISAGDEKTNVNWIVPDESEDMTTCQWSNVKQTRGVDHYYDPELIAKLVTEFKTKSLFQITKNSDGTKMTLNVFGKAYAIYHAPIVVDGQINKVPDFI